MKHQTTKQKKFIIGGLWGIALGLIILHPFAMLFQGIAHPALEFKLDTMLLAFKSSHFPMAMFFGLLGLIMGLIITHFQNELSHDKELIEQLEGLLPICSYCRKIKDRDKERSGKDVWVQLEKYISQRTAADFTHGVCPECYEKILSPEIDRSGSKGVS